MKVMRTLLAACAVLLISAFAAVISEAAEGPFAPPVPTVNSSDPRIAVVASTRVAKVGDQVGIGRGVRFADRVTIHYSASYCKDSSQNAWLRTRDLPFSSLTGDATYFTVGPELAGCNIEITFTASNSGNYGQRGALETVRLYIER